MATSSPSACVLLALTAALACRAEHASTTPPAPAPRVETPPPDEPPAVAPTPNAPACAQAPGWRYERIELPPAFAPTLPSGVETLWFAPGMFDPAAEDYFTYAFSLDWNEPLEPEAEQIEAWLTDYFRGLMSAVAKAREAEPVRAASVTVSPDGTTVQVVMSDEFTEIPEIELSIRLSGDGDCMRLWATARPSAGTWAALERADTCLCPP